MPDNPKHAHLCARCGRRYECDDPEDADLEYGYCSDKCEREAEKKRGGQK